MKRTKTVLGEARQIALASDLIHLGARLQVLESEITLSRERLLKLYKEIAGKSPPKGMLPFSTDWFMAWQPNIHSSLFMNLYQSLITSSELDGVEAVIRAYRMYRERIGLIGMPEVLSITRAWRLTRFFDAGMLTLTPCTECGGHFVVHTFELTKDYVCGLCDMPSRAGKTRAVREAHGHDAHCEEHALEAVAA
ncbi:MAG: flagellar transcriptional regulator FlhC [Burkholderiales bacterium]|nr:flagellar transcriptional regulator FlhC [Burkholderiales bacterium]